MFEIDWPASDISCVCSCTIVGSSQFTDSRPSWCWRRWHTA